MIGTRPLTIIKDVEQVEFRGFGCDCVSTAEIFTVAGSALPDEFF